MLLPFVLSVYACRCIGPYPTPPAKFSTHLLPGTFYALLVRDYCRFIRSDFARVQVHPARQDRARRDDVRVRRDGPGNQSPSIYAFTSWALDFSLSSHRVVNLDRARGHDIRLWRDGPGTHPPSI